MSDNINTLNTEVLLELFDERIRQCETDIAESFNGINTIGRQVFQAQTGMNKAGAAVKKMLTEVQKKRSENASALELQFKLFEETAQYQANSTALAQLISEAERELRVIAAAETKNTAESQKLREVLAETGKQLEKLESEMAAVQEQLAAAEKMADQKKKMFLQVKESSSAAETALGKLKTEQDALQAEMLSYRQLEAAIDGHFQFVKEQIAAVNIQKMEETLSTEKSRLRKLTAQRGELDRKLISAERTHPEIAEQMRRQITHLEQDIVASLFKIEFLTEELENDRAHLEKLEKEKAEGEQLLGNLAEILKQQKDKLDEKKEEVREKEAYFHKYSEMAEDAGQLSDQNEAEIREKKDRLVELKEKKLELTEKVRETEYKLKLQEAENVARVGNKKAAEKKLAGMKQAEVSMKEDYYKMEKKCRDHLAVVKQKQQELEKVLAEMDRCWDEKEKQMRAAEAFTVEKEKLGVHREYCSAEIEMIREWIRQAELSE